MKLTENSRIHDFHIGSLCIDNETKKGWVIFTCAKCGLVTHRHNGGPTLIPQKPYADNQIAYCNTMRRTRPIPQMKRKNNSKIK